MSERIIPFPNKINNPPLFRGIQIDILIVGAGLCVGSFLLTAFFGGGIHSLFAVFFSLTLGLPLYVYAKKKMNRGYVSHWFWSRGRKKFQTKKSDRDNLPSDFLPKGFQTEFKD